MILVDHLAAAAATTALLRCRRGVGLAFIVGSTLIDLDHYPSAARRYGLINPLDGIRFGLTGRIPGWDPNDPRYPVHVRRPMHHPAFVVTLGITAWLWCRTRPLALGMLMHLFLDLVDMLNTRITR